MGNQLGDRLARWAELAGIDPSLLPRGEAIARIAAGRSEPFRPGISPREIDDWESRHGHMLPTPLRLWLLESNGFYLGSAPLIHPLSGIGPMVPFARRLGPLVQPESWFELGNPFVETVCVDLAYDWPSPGGGPPIFTSGDDETRSPRRVIASSFETWFLETLRQGGREFWLAPDFPDLGEPWTFHRLHAPPPPLPERLRAFAPSVRPLMRPGADDRAIAHALGISRGDVEALFRHLQHVSPRNGDS